jgi:polyisoprenyl-teichoic acid--peptidoglycan teichoic acid transferase
MIKVFKKPVVFLPVILAIIVVSASAYYFLVYSKNNSGANFINPLSGQLVDTEIISDLPTPIPQDKVINFLLLGKGEPGHDGSELADSLTVVHLDIPNKTASLISIPRDTWVTMTDDQGKLSNHKINESYLFGSEQGGVEKGLKQAELSVGQVTDLSIKYTILIDFGGFSQAIDKIGGVDVIVPQVFEDNFYPIKGLELETCGKTPEEVAKLSSTLSGFELEKQFTCRYEKLHFDAGKNHMDGTTALKYVRSRHSSSDFARGQRQRAVLLAVTEKLLSLETLKNAGSFYDKMKGLIKSDLDRQAWVDIAEMIIQPKDYKTTEIGLSDQNVLVSSKSSGGAYILIPKAGTGQWGDVQKYIKDQMGNLTP